MIAPVSGDRYSDSETTAGRGQAAGLRAPQHSLRVWVEDNVAAHGLPSFGEVSLGRNPDAQVVIRHPNVSRQHAILRIDRKMAMCDLGSSNGTFFAGRKLEPRAWQPIEAGDFFLLGGEVTVLVHDGPAAERPIVAMGTSPFFEQVREKLEEYKRGGSSVAVCTVRCITTRRWIDLLAAALLRRDRIAVLTDSMACLLLVGRTDDQATRTAAAIEDHLRRIGALPTVELAICPRDGRTVEDLVPPVVSQPPSEAEKRSSKRPPAPASEAMRKLNELIGEVAASPISVLILGETGAGKEVCARNIHKQSPRQGGPFVALNCAALPETLLESELFGHEKGAFTGAVAAKPGLLETAEKGTLLLDEIGEMPLKTQAKLLRVLEERSVLRVGGLKPRPIDVRVLAATNRDLRAEIAQGTFRADLYYRLNGLSLTVPPLRERASEIVPLAEYFCSQSAEALKKARPTFDPDTLYALVRYEWPGNVRELRSVIERAVLLSRNGVIVPDNLPDEIVRPPALSRRTNVTTMPPRTAEVPSLAFGDDEGSHVKSLPDEMEKLERRRIMDALDKCNGNQTRAAALLGMSRRVLISRIERYNLPRPRARK
jgi:DNA-binding NtrC family response regulator